MTTMDSPITDMDMDSFVQMNIFDYMQDEQFFKLSSQPWFKRWAETLSPRVRFKFPMRELLCKVEALKCFDCFVINKIFSCWKCLVGHGELLSDANIVGGTGYIDQVTITQMSGVINVGQDHFARPYCTISGYIIDAGAKKRRRYCFTMFQRYRDDSTVWQYGTCYPDRLVFSGSLGGQYNGDVRHAIRSMIQGTGYSLDRDIEESHPVKHQYSPVHLHDCAV